MRRDVARDARAALPACLITFVLMILCSRVYGIFPCGDNSVVWCDMKQQAVPLLVQLRQQFLSGDSIFYTLLDAGGMQFYGIFFFFLSNPLSFLVLVSDVPADLLVNVLVFVKLALASGTAAVWLRRRVPACSTAMLVLLAVMYGCSGYGLFYYQNLMWLDIMLMLPLLMLAMRYLVKTGKALPYFLVLCTLMVFCFYLCYMIVLFVLIYMALSLRFDAKKEMRGRAARCFVGASALAACVTAVIWLPCFLQVMHSARSGSVINRLTNSYLFNNLQDKLSLLMCTMLIFAVIPSLLMRKGGLSKRDRRLFLLLLLAIALDPVNMMWHTGNYQAFPLRWGMIPILLLLTAAAEQFTEGARAPMPADQPKQRIAVPLLICLGLMLCALTADALLVRFAGRTILSYVRTLWVSIPAFFLLLIPALFLLAGYFAVLVFYRRRQLSMRLCTALTAAFFCCEFAMNFHCYVGAQADDDILFSQTMSAEGHLPQTDTVDRVRLTKKYTHANMVGALGYPTLAHYTSMTREDFLHGVKRMGYSSYWMEVNSIGGTPLSDAVWHIRYLLASGSDLPSWTDRIWSDGRFILGENRMMLPSVLAVDASPAQLADLPMGSRADVQRFLGTELLGLTDFVTEYSATGQEEVALSTDAKGRTVCTLLTEKDENGEQASGLLRFAAFVKGRQALYFDLYSQTGIEIGNPRNKSVRISVNGRTVEMSYPENDHNGLQFLGEFEDSYVSVQVRVNKSFTCESFGVFGMDLDKLASALKAAEGTDLHYEKSTYTAHYHADSPRTLIFSTAYDEGFTAEVNGKPVPVHRVLDCMTAVEVPAGENEITLKFHVSGLKAGCLIALCGLFAAAVFVLLRRRLPQKTRARLNGGANLLVQAGYCAVIALVYILPLILWAFGSVRWLLRLIS